MTTALESAWMDQFARLRATLTLPVDSIIQRELGMAGGRLSLRAASARALEAVARPVEALPTPSNESTSLIVEIAECGGALFDELVPTRVGSTNETRPRLRLGDGQETFGAVWPLSGMFALFDRRSAHAQVGLRDVERISISDAATLVRALAAWWRGDHQAGVVHAAAVSGKYGAALLTGPGGTGKSCTATAAFLGGLGFIGDDSVFCQADTAEVFSLNTYVNLYERDLAGHYGSLGDGAPAREGKATIDLAGVAPDRVLASSRLRAVVALDRSGMVPTGLQPAGRGRVLASLGPSSVFNVPTNERRTLTMIANLLRTVPCYTLGLEENRASAVAPLRHLLDRVEPI